MANTTIMTMAAASTQAPAFSGARRSLSYAMSQPSNATAVLLSVKSVPNGHPVQ